ncbi:LON peptidase substrate-binding domain-containing protein [Stappia sp. F7233]|uniref:LON peptidase substrate-binding domain-containing protein n=1 Tax=Stappia albiluteola TaxID=2758565 RepID=A0A839AHU6_9HYPH|nr:LON peptidase substrate-binding domain-containing protein [Stappia albiluteola]MBA5778504.1 LON peptidase substrate-binding domain-containing protein [Stappia albiluteola]
MLAGNASYDGPGDLPRVIPLFPLTGALLLPQAQMPLNIFEPRYLAMVEAALKGDRIIGMVQPDFRLAGADSVEHPPLCAVGCAGRIIAFQETGDGRYLITLAGIARFEIVEELETTTPYRQAVVSAEKFGGDFQEGLGEDDVDRDELVKTLRAYLEANDLEADWSSVSEATTEVLVNALSMMSPYGAAEKQLLLEAPDLKTRAATLVALTEVHLARKGDDGGRLQ